MLLRQQQTKVTNQQTHKNTTTAFETTMRTKAYYDDELLTQKERNKNEQEHLKLHIKLKPSISQFDGKISDINKSCCRTKIPKQLIGEMTELEKEI